MKSLFFSRYFLIFTFHPWLGLKDLLDNSHIQCKNHKIYFQILYCMFRNAFGYAQHHGHGKL